MYNFAYIRNHETKINEFEPSQKDIVFLFRGLTRSYKAWLGLEEELSEQFDVLCIDLPGIGLSKNEKLLFKVEQIAEKMVEVINNLKIKKLYIVAPSLGSMIAWEIVKTLPLSKIAGLVVLVPSHSGMGVRRLSFQAFTTLSSASFSSEEVRLARLKDLLIGKTTEGKNIFEEDMVLERKWKNSIVEDFHDLGTKGQLSQIFAAGTYMSKAGLDYVKRNQIPLKFLVSTDDRMIPVSHVYSIYEYIKHPYSELIDMKNAGHDFIVTHKEQVKEIITNFINDKEKYKRIPVTQSVEKKKSNKIVNTVAVGVGLLALGLIFREISKKKKY